MGSPNEGVGHVRKFLLIGIAVAACAAAMSSLAVGATGARCGTRYTKPCTGPIVTVRTPPVVCQKPGSSFALPSATLSSLPGLRKVVVTEGSKVIKTVTFKGRGPQQYSLKGLTLSTSGLHAGVHSVTITVTDVRGKKASRTLHFSVCAIVPPFTG